MDAPIQIKPNHPYHLVDPSPWPIVGSLAVFLLALGAILMFRNITHFVFLGGVVLTLSTMFGWWYDVIKESKSDHSLIVRHGFRYGMVFFIASEVMFFAAFFWAYLHAAINPFETLGHIWPPQNINTPDPFDLPYYNTLLLLLSGTTITWAHHEMVEGKLKQALTMTLVTVGLGTVFLGVQMIEYSEATFKLKDGIYPSTFYLATGFHGAHVFIGVCFLATCAWRIHKQHFKSDDHFGFEAASWYWHFVDVVWLFLFILVYWWGSAH